MNNRKPFQRAVGSIWEACFLSVRWFHHTLALNDSALSCVANVQSLNVARHLTIKCRWKSRHQRFLSFQYQSINAHARLADTELACRPGLPLHRFLSLNGPLFLKTWIPHCYSWRLWALRDSILSKNLTAVVASFRQELRYDYFASSFFQNKASPKKEDASAKSINRWNVLSRKTRKQKLRLCPHSQDWHYHRVLEVVKEATRASIRMLNV